MNRSSPSSGDFNSSPQTIVRRMSEADFTVALHVLKQAVDATSSGIIICNPHLPDNPIIYHNPTFERLTDYSEHEATGRNCRFRPFAASRFEPSRVPSRPRTRRVPLAR